MGARWDRAERDEAEGKAEVVEGGVDLAKGGFHVAGVARCPARLVVRREGGERPEHTGAELYQQHAALETAGGQPVPPAAADPLV